MGPSVNDLKITRITVTCSFNRTNKNTLLFRNAIRWIVTPK